MTNITITINTDNAAFEAEAEAFETACILQKLSDRMFEYDTVEKFASLNWNMRDSNGNKVGEFLIDSGCGV